MLSTEDLATFDRDGYLVVERVLSKSRVNAALDECWEIGASLVRSAVASGEVPAALLDLPGPAQLIELTRLTGKSYGQHFDIALPSAGTIRGDMPMNLGPKVFSVLVDTALLDLVEEVVGPEIVCNPTEHLRIKLPLEALPSGADGLSARVGWHQDNGVLLEEADGSHVLTVWIPLTDATVANGPLVVFPGSHTRGLLSHCSSPFGYAIPDAKLGGDPLPLEMPAGSVLLMHKRTIHGSLDNVSRSDVRASLDLRYQPAGEPTGRPLYPSFLVRSARAPEDVLTSHDVWASAWLATRDRLAERELAGAMYRWDSGADYGCA